MLDRDQGHKVVLHNGAYSKDGARSAAVARREPQARFRDTCAMEVHSFQKDEHSVAVSDSTQKSGISVFKWLADNSHPFGH
jgi:hypothetical protein